MDCARVLRLSKLFEARRANNEDTTGDTLVGIQEMPPTPPTTRDGFDALVSTLYKWFVESVKPDHDFLQQSTVVEGQDSLRGFYRTLKAVRHSRQHIGFDDRSRAERWLRDACGAAEPMIEDEFESCSRALVAEAEKAIVVMIAMAKEANKDHLIRSQWDAQLRVKEFGADEALASALQLVGRTPNGHDLAYLKRMLDSTSTRYLNGPGRGRPLSEALAACASQVVAAWLLQPLGRPPDRIVDEVGGSPTNAQTILLLSYVLQEAGVGSNELASATARAWKLLSDAQLV